MSLDPKIKPTKPIALRVQKQKHVSQREPTPEKKDVEVPNKTEVPQPKGMYIKRDCLLIISKFSVGSHFYVSI